MAIPMSRHERRVVAQNPHARSIVVSYLGLRKSLGMMAMVLPIILGPIGWLVFDIPIQVNVSSYYHTPMRDVFVGMMFSMGVFLYCYHGYDSFENWTGNLACGSAVGIALCPLESGSDPLHQSTPWGLLHTLCGGTFFLTLAIFSLYHFPRTHFGISLQTRDDVRDKLYQMTGLVLLGAMFLMASYLLFVRGSFRELLDGWSVFFWLECIAIWAFGIAWLIKGQALLADTKASVE